MSVEASMTTLEPMGAENWTLKPLEFIAAETPEMVVLITGTSVTAVAAHSPGPEPERFHDMEIVPVPALKLLEPHTSPPPVPVN